MYDFHARFDIPNLNDKSHYDDPFPRLCTRLAFLMEETGEHARELNQASLDRAADEMADVAFVAMGTLLELDAIGANACCDVADKNDKKDIADSHSRTFIRQTHQEVAGAMNVLLVGNGAREHAIAWKLSQSPMVGLLFVAPGNAGTYSLARNVPIGADDIPALLDFACDNAIDLTVVGPEGPLAEGIVDAFTNAGLLAFGPTKNAARIEGSKTFAKSLMADCAVPTAMSDTFTDFEGARAHLDTCPIPIVVKADGLAAGKGVTVAQTREQAYTAIRESMLERQFGVAGDCVVIEECLEGQEVSVFAFVDGAYVSPMVAACDYKRVRDGDTGPNTGGMGSFSPPLPQHWNAAIESQVRSAIMEPVAQGLVNMGCPYRGMLYLGMMITADGPKVIEFNCRFGDPETQVILPRLKSDLAEVLLATARGELQGMQIEWDSRACVGVVTASGGYPAAYTTGHPITGINEVDHEAMVFHAGTRLEGSSVATDGGRVLTVASLGDTIEQARVISYDNIKRITFKDGFYRTDIASF